MVQILILAAVAAFLFWRLSLVLGIRTGFETKLDINVKNQNLKKKSDNVTSNSFSDDEDISDYVELTSKAGQQFKKIKVHEPKFSVKNFVSGAKGAYELILMAFEKGNLDLLKNHLAKDVYKDFEAVVIDRADNGYTVDASFGGLREIRIRDVLFDQESMVAEISVFFKCELTSVVKDKNDVIVEGNNSKVKTHTDLWTFGRVIGTEDPAWKLIATGE